MIPIEQDILVFLHSIRLWWSKLADEIAELEGRGQEGCDRWKEILFYFKESSWVMRLLYDPDYYPVDATDNSVARLNFLSDWTDAEIHQMMSDYAFRWKMNANAGVNFAGETLVILEGAVVIGGSMGGDSLLLPPGGSNGDMLVKSGVSLAWVTPATAFDMGEI